MLASPLHLDIRAGAVGALASLLHERSITSGGTVMVAVGTGQGTAIWDRVRPSLPNATVFQVEEGSLASAGDLQAELGKQGYDAVVGIGGGKTIDVAKYAATRAAVPMVAVATNLAHDGICSPVASLEHPHGKGSYGVALPLAVVVDLDYVRTAPAPDGPRRDRGTRSATCPRSRTGCWRSASVGRPSTASRWRSPAPPARRSCTGPTGSGTTGSSSRSPRPWCSPAWRCRWPGRPGRAAGPATRSCTRSTSSSPGSATTASWPASGRSSPPSSAGTSRAWS
ncbi:iron-containing alcohol dehydrogenase [Nocardioides sp. TF02-7]|uniref:iron-containing alcohol dehydrogenase n=1 Tax=Nocardioides sp. TF02-7 TaxID=2917724 RepID=UPI001F05DB40|nr:iron-containing alcohol dehydrogenase [Nocardioides sp. TF02-7]UMG93198.1 iron-containing alcohol dehydrogenase [Nocardioides sp. TF02-7]